MSDHVVDLTPDDRALAKRLVRVQRVGAKGRGVVAARDIPALTLVAPYPGPRFTTRQHALRLERGVTDGTFAIDFWRPDARGAIRAGYVLDPGRTGRPGQPGQPRQPELLPRFADAVAPLVNEPGPTGTPNLLWVWNLPRYRLELWTARDVRRGEELTACYGTDGGYERGYRTACVLRQDSVEPQVHVVVRRGARPVPYSLWRAGG